MIRVSNPKPISEINRLRDMGLYNAPFSVHEAIESIDIKDSLAREKIEEAEIGQAMSLASIYEAMEEMKKDMEIKQMMAIAEVYENVGGM